MAQSIKSEPIEVQIMDDISCLIEEDQREARGVSIEEFLEKMPQLEKQIELCLGNQSLLQQILAKCNQLEGQLQELRNDFDQQRLEVRPLEGKEIADAEGTNPKPKINQRSNADVEAPGVPNLVTFKQCSYCPGSLSQKKFIRADTLAHHCATHHGMKEEVPTPQAAVAPSAGNPDCKPPCPTKEAAKPRPQGPDTSCPHCGRVYSSLRSLKRHIMSVHKLPLACESCGKWFHRLDKLNLHQKMHSEGTSKQQGKKHSKGGSQQLKTKRSKRSSKPRDRNRRDGFPMEDRTCSEAECGKVFGTPKDMKRHLARQHCEPSFTCDVCGDKFRRKDKLKSHKERNHSGQRKPRARRTTEGGKKSKRVPAPGFCIDLDYFEGMDF